jgi:hypothetical protein
MSRRASACGIMGGEGAIPPRRRGRSEDTHERPDAPGRRVRPTPETIERMLSAVRRDPRMDVAFVSEFAGDELVFRALEGDAESFGWQKARASRSTSPTASACSTGASPSGPRREARGGDEGPQGDQRGGHGLLLRGAARALGRAALRHFVLREPRARPLAQGARPGAHGRTARRLVEHLERHGQL